MEISPSGPPSCFESKSFHLPYSESQAPAITFYGGRPRLSHNCRRRTVIDGPFTAAKELIAGCAIIQAKSKDEAIESTQRFVTVDAPGRYRKESDCKIRQRFELEDLPVDPAEKPEGRRQVEKRLRDK